MDQMSLDIQKVSFHSCPDMELSIKLVTEFFIVPEGNSFSQIHTSQTYMAAALLNYCIRVLVVFVQTFYGRGDRAIFKSCLVAPLCPVPSPRGMDCE